MTIPLEQDVKESRVLCMDYTVRCHVRAVVRPGYGGIQRAIEELVRTTVGQQNIDPRSVRFEFLEEETVNGCSPDDRY